MRSNIARIIVGILAGLLLLIGNLISLYHLAYKQKIYPYVSIGEIELSNLSINQAEIKLSKLSSQKPNYLEIIFGNQKWELDLQELELEYDPQLTVQQAYLLGRGRGWLKDLKIKWQLWWKKQSLMMTFNIDDEKISNLVKLIASQVDEPPIIPELQLTKDGAVSLIPAKNGRLVDKEKLQQQLLVKIGDLNFSETTVPVTIINLQITGDQLSKAQEKADILRQKSLQLNYDYWFKAELKDQELLSLIGFENVFTEDKIASYSMNLAVKINRPAQNAVFRFENNRAVEFKPALPGLVLDEKETSQLIIEGLDKLVSEEHENIQETINLPVMTSQPQIKTEDVNDLGIKQLLGKGESTFYGSITSRRHNLALTATKINGILIPPGEVFSFNKEVGDISAATGYQSAYIIKDGRTILGDGGGVCQDSTTMFRAALNAGLEIIERHPHSYRVGYYEQNSPTGVDATVYAPSTDLKFKNDTPAHILIQTKVNTATSYIAIEIYGTNDGRQATISNFRLWGQTPPPPDQYQDDPTLPAGVIKQVDWKAWGGKAAFDWQVIRNNDTIHKKTFYSNYQPWQAVFLRGTGS